MNSARHHSCPADVRFRTLDDLNRNFEDTLFPQLLRYGTPSLNPPNHPCSLRLSPSECGD